jgi:hypothetical protein
MWLAMLPVLLVRFCSFHRGRFWLVMVVVMVVAGLSGGDRCSRGSTGDSSDLFRSRGGVAAAVLPESGLSPSLQGLFSVLSLLVLLPLPLSRLSTLSTSLLCHELFP